MSVRPRQKSNIKKRESTIQVRKKSALLSTPTRASSVARTEDFSEARKQVVISILTGRRPMLLMKTLRSLVQRAPLLAAEAHVVVLVNGNDEPTRSVLKNISWVNEVHHTDTLLPIGEGFSTLMRLALGQGQRYVLHLEDDWECCNEEDSWFHKAVHTIEKYGVGQVRLRNAKDMVMPVNALSQQKIKWEKFGDSLSIAKNAHFTFNPSLVPAVVMQGLHPCESETDAMHKYAVTQLPVAQLVPGAFLHIGGGDQSLADKTGGR
ncbi:MAG TPA: hypothetical protein VFI71_14525 [Pyrinomonadaceae bacterium]|nr:hypothetical protein [Pyrinomonadaceae bacterium]